MLRSSVFCMCLSKPGYDKGEEDNNTAKMIRICSFKTLADEQRRSIRRRSVRNKTKSSSGINENNETFTSLRISSSEDKTIGLTGNLKCKCLR